MYLFKTKKGIFLPLYFKIGREEIFPTIKLFPSLSQPTELLNSEKEPYHFSLIFKIREGKAL